MEYFMKKYDAFCIVPLNKVMRFCDTYISDVALMDLQNIDCKAFNGDDDTAHECRDIESFKNTDSVVPIRIMTDVTGLDFSDDWTVASPIKELEFGPVNRWWPKEWFISNQNKPFKWVRIEYKDIVLNLKLITVSDDVLNESFIDVITPIDMLSDDVSIAQNSVVKGDNTMAFGKKSNIKIEGQIEEPTAEIEVPAGSEPTVEIENSANTPNSESSEDKKIHLDLNDVEIIDVDLKPKKKISKSAAKKVLIAAGVTTAVAAAGVGVYFGVRAIINKRNGESVTAE